jgi:two-component system, cell cycle sensor histidine kinase and response regulator CckA
MDGPLALGHGESILFVDDDSAVCRMAEEVLRRAGYLPHSFTSPLDALEKIKTDPQAFQVVVTDVSMPMMSGISLAQEVKRIAAGTPVILMSGFAGALSMEKLHGLGADLSLTKPLAARTLSEVVKAAIDLKSNSRSPT